jgi:hypothetical protein
MARTVVFTVAWLAFVVLAAEVLLRVPIGQVTRQHARPTAPAYLVRLVPR